MKVLLAVDGSPYTQRMLAYLSAHEGLLGPNHDYTAITAVSPVPPQVTGYVDRKLLDQHYADEAAGALKAVQAFAERTRWKIATVHRVGNPADVIAEAARTAPFDLLVMGSHGHSPIGSLMLGSVTARVMAQANIPVLVIR